MIVSNATERQWYKGGLLMQRLMIASCYLLSVYVAYTFLKYLQFKFIPDPMLNPIFQDLEEWSGIDWVNPYFRYFTGGVELAASVLLFLPGLQVLGALLTIGTLVSAMLLHLFGPIGIEGARGDLFAEAVVCTVIGCWIVFVRRKEMLSLLRFLLVDRTWRAANHGS